MSNPARPMQAGEIIAVLQSVAPHTPVYFKSGEDDTVNQFERVHCVQPEDMEHGTDEGSYCKWPNQELINDEDEEYCDQLFFTVIIT